MKYLISLFLLGSLIGCGPKFRVGDCIEMNNIGKLMGIWKINKVVTKGYRIEWIYPNSMIHIEDFQSFDLDKVYHKTECPK